MPRANIAAVAAGASVMIGGSAAAAELGSAGQSRLYLHVGPAAVALDEGAEIRAGGAVIPGGTIYIKTNVTPVLELGYFLSRNVAISFTGGWPPLAKVEGAGTLEGAGTIGKSTYGPMALTAHYHFNPEGTFRPYVGAGPVFMYVFSEQDGLVRNLNVKHNFGFAVQAGAEVSMTERLGLFLDVKKARLRTTATGSLGPAPMTSKIKMDPLVIHAGVALKL